MPLGEEVARKIEALYADAEAACSPEVYDVDRALSLLARVIYLTPDDARAFTMRAEIYLSLGDLKSALSNFRRSLELQPDDKLMQKRIAAVLDTQGNQALEDGDYDVAAAIFSRAIELDGLTWQYFLHLALTKIALGQLRLAMRDLDHVLILHKFSPDVFILRAKLRWLLGNVPAGNADFRAAHSIDPTHGEVVEFEDMLWKNAEIAYREASSALMRRDFQRGLRKLNAAIELNPEDVKILILRASAYRSTQQYSHALADLDEAARVFHSQRSAVLEKARAANAKSDGGGGSKSPSNPAPPQPIEFAEHAEITRQRNLTLNDLAVERFKRRDFRGAITLFNQVIESEANSDISGAAAREGQSFVNTSFFSNRGDCHRELGQLQSALADYHVAYDLNPDNWETKTRLAMLHDSFGLELFNASQYSDALVEFSTALGYNGRVVQIYLHRARTAQKLGKLERAYKDYLEVLRLDGNNAAAQRALTQFGGVPIDLQKGLGGVGRQQQVRGQKSASNLPKLRRGGKHHGSSGYLIPPHVPDVLVKSRKREVRRKKRVNNLFEGSCNLNDPLLKLLKAAKKNPYAKGAN